LPDHRLIVARGFQIAGWVLGAPSVLIALGSGIAAVVLGGGPAGSKPHYLSVSTYGIAGLLSNAATGVGGALSVLNGLAGWVLGLLAVLALLATLFAGLLYLVGRGLKVSAAWARFVGGAMMGVMSLNSLLALAVLRGGARLADAALLALFAYGLWVIGWRFEDPVPADRADG